MGWFSKAKIAPEAPVGSEAVWVPGPALHERHVIVSYDNPEDAAAAVAQACRAVCSTLGIALFEVSSVGALAEAASSATGVVLIADFDDLTVDIEDRGDEGSAAVTAAAAADVRFVIGTGHQDGEVLEVLEQLAGRIEASVIEDLDVTEEHQTLTALLTRALGAPTAG